MTEHEKIRRARVELRRIERSVGAIQIILSSLERGPEAAKRRPLQAVVQPSDSEAVNRAAGQMKRTVQTREGERQHRSFKDLAMSTYRK